MGNEKAVGYDIERPFEATKTEAYRALFSVQEVNVAVYLGKASGGLCAIDFDRDEDLAAFLAANPKLNQTTQSRGSRGGMLWLRMGLSGKLVAHLRGIAERRGAFSGARLDRVPDSLSLKNAPGQAADELLPIPDIGRGAKTALRQSRGRGGWHLLQNEARGFLSFLCAHKSLAILRRRL
jgi:hypothetical protein